MTARLDSLPDLTRADVGAALFSNWRLGTPERQQAAVDAIGAAWESRPWPTPDLRSYTVFASTDGETLLHYSQWADDDAYHAFVRTHRRQRVNEIDTAVPGIERYGLTSYRRYRSTEPTAETRAPRCFVTVKVEFDGPDVPRARAWVDGVFNAAAADAAIPAGLIAAHFHVSTDGSKVLNFAEWTSEQAHQDVLDTTGTRSATARAARDFPGVRNLTITRHRFALHLAAPANQ
ncbi:antibiotic biosynthesis monooxygenase [Amycolatopsis anabasis]|uniref:antibiotic biosynthesis monooxygenase n=1 Tax=Amycolatopsis anabasis TaxID=1840409 RepID=UPI00131AD402|nr:antibiotic biosynthesis monooxygenase [Amycolatopsis anabasis]